MHAGKFFLCISSLFMIINKYVDSTGKRHYEITVVIIITVLFSIMCLTKVFSDNEICTFYLKIQILYLELLQTLLSSKYSMNFFQICVFICIFLNHSEIWSNSSVSQIRNNLIKHILV
jgi:ABC-type multidrug transport system permease subunit